MLNKFGDLTPLYFIVRRVLNSTTFAQFELGLPLILENSKSVFVTSADHHQQFEEIVWVHFLQGHW
jgi:hypothetical protein